MNICKTNNDVSVINNSSTNLTGENSSSDIQNSIEYSLLSTNEKANRIILEVKQGLYDYQI